MLEHRERQHEVGTRRSDRMQILTTPQLEGDLRRLDHVRRPVDHLLGDVDADHLLEVLRECRTVAPETGPELDGEGSPGGLDRRVEQGDADHLLPDGEEAIEVGVVVVSAGVHVEDGVLASALVPVVAHGRRGAAGRGHFGARGCMTVNLLLAGRTLVRPAGTALATVARATGRWLNQPERGQ